MFDFIRIIHKKLSVEIFLNFKKISYLLQAKSDLICILIVLVLILCMTQVCICTTKRTLMLLNVHSLSYLLCKTSPQGIGGHQIFITAKLFKVDTIWL